MNEPKTSNLGLNKINRSSPSTTYFDLDKYLDQNWEKIDEGVGKVEEKAEDTAAQVSSIQERLDTEKRKSVTLEPGLQVVHSERASAFKLDGLKGRTLVNLLGRDGGFYNLNHWSYWSASPPNVNNNKVTVIGTGSNLNPQITYTNLGLAPKVGEKLFLRAKAIPKNLCSAVRLYLYSSGEKIIFNAMTAVNPAVGEKLDLYGIITVTQQIVDNWSSIGFILVTEYSTTTNATNAVTEYAQAAMYKISIVDQSLTPQQVAAKYPYVESVQPVRNPYVIRYGEYLLPPFYEWEHTGHTFLETSPYTATGELVSGSIGTDAYAVTYLSVLANQDYTISNPAASTGKIRVSVYDSYTRLQGMFINPGETKTIKTVSSAVRMGVNLSGVTQYTEEFDVNKWTWSTGNKASFAYPIMTLGKEVKPLKTCEDSMLALQTELYSDPVTGLNADEVFEKNGQYYKMTKWRKIILDESLRYRSIASSSGYKVVGCTLSEPVAAFNSLVVTKYNGNVLTKNGNMSESDNAYFRIADLSDFNVSIASADSGWGDSYTPTADEIKAYFMGWRMYNGESAFYNGSGTKYWHKLSDGTSTPGVGTTTLPTTKAPDLTPYQLVYQLAVPTIDPITSEGQLTFLEGDNQVEVGSGMIIRESVKPVYTSDVHKSYNINNYNLSAKLNSRVKKILSVYKNDVRDYWDILRFNPESEVYGLELASLPASQYDPSAYYTVTYQVQDQFSPIWINGTIGVSEKSIIEQFINDSSNISRQLSVVESKNNEMELQKYADKNYLRKSSGISENQDLNGFVAEGEYYCQFNTTAETLKNCPVGVAFSLKVSKNGTQNKESILGVTQTLITFLPVGFTTWQRNFYDSWGAWVQVPSREEFESLKSSVSDGKSAIAAAITAKGVAASGSDTHLELARKINQINVGPKYATGTIQSAATSMYFMTYNGSYAFNYLSVSNLDFRPNKIIIRRTVQASGEDLNVYDYYTRAAAENSTGSNYNYYTFSNGQGRSAYIVNVYEYSGLGIPSSNAFVNSSGFRVPVLNSNTSYTWEAFRI